MFTVTAFRLSFVVPSPFSQNLSLSILLVWDYCFWCLEQNRIFTINYIRYSVSVFSTAFTSDSGLNAMNLAAANSRSFIFSFLLFLFVLVAYSWGFFGRFLFRFISIFELAIGSVIRLTVGLSFMETFFFPNSGIVRHVIYFGSRLHTKCICGINRDKM